MGLFMTMFNTKGSELTKINLHFLPLRWRFMEEKLCCMYGKITMVLLIFKSLNCNQTLSAALYSQLLQYVHRNLLRKYLTLVNRRKMMIQSHIQQKSYRKKYWILADLFYFIHHIHQPLNQVISIFCCLQNALKDKTFSQEDQVKMFVELDWLLI